MTPFLATLLLFSIDSTPKNGETILFVGDSITQAGDYVADVEAYLLACRPSENFRVINVGKSSETVSGTSEPDHHPPRPCIHDRFARDVAAFKPNIVVACYGMNDGNYFPFEESRFEKYKAGMNRFIERVFKETPARALVLLTPPVFDASKAPPPPEDGKDFGYKHPAKDYNYVLRKYSDWLLTLKSDRVTVVDVHRAFQLALRNRRDRIVQEFTLSPDSVHPNTIGHSIIAQSILCEWSVRPSWSIQSIDLAGPNAQMTHKGDVWKWKTQPITAPTVELLTHTQTFSQDVRDGLIARELFGQTIRVVGLPDGIFDVRAFGGHLMQAERKWLNTELFLGDHFDVGRKPTSVIIPVMKRRQKVSGAWLAAQENKPFDDLRLSTEAVIKAEKETAELTKSIDEARKPRSFEIQITQSREL